MVCRGSFPKPLPLPSCPVDMPSSQSLGRPCFQHHIHTLAGSFLHAFLFPLLCPSTVSPSTGLPCSRRWSELPQLAALCPSVSPRFSSVFQSPDGPCTPDDPSAPEASAWVWGGSPHPLLQTPVSSPGHRAQSVARAAGLRIRLSSNPGATASQRSELGWARKLLGLFVNMLFICNCSLSDGHYPVSVKVSPNDCSPRPESWELSFAPSHLATRWCLAGFLEPSPFPPDQTTTAGPQLSSE